MEPMGHIAGSAAAANGFASATGAALIGALVGRLYAGDAALIPSGFLILGAAALAVVFSTERGRLFHPQQVAAEAAE
jgi:DHA1 family bicyclomycin/chloramphenicol resistance-like MFS transporter